MIGSVLSKVVVSVDQVPSASAVAPPAVAPPVLPPASLPPLPPASLPPLPPLPQPLPLPPLPLPPASLPPALVFAAVPPWAALPSPGVPSTWPCAPPDELIEPGGCLLLRDCLACSTEARPCASLPWPAVLSVSSRLRAACAPPVSVCAPVICVERSCRLCGTTCNVPWFVIVAPFEDVS
ncbi:MAG: hypothetical protein DLM58_09285 [Pseudonocardiales bacterium]|nr:MAG: hypothetical protein DLM58_09285 [Pseudonocardiales bacterium]